LEKTFWFTEYLLKGYGQTTLLVASALVQPAVGIALPVRYVNENITHHFDESNIYGGWSDRFIQQLYLTDNHFSITCKI
jgi:hypothetical protein